MKCPYCGTQLNENMTYCPDCGGKLKQEDNSKDDTLRLPDLSSVPLGDESPRARRASPPPKKNNAALITVAVCAMIIAVAAAICIAIALSGRNTEPIAPNSQPGEPEDGYRYDSPDYAKDEDGLTFPDDYDDEPEQGNENKDDSEQENENNTEEIKKDSEADNKIFAEDVTPELDVSEPEESEEPETPDEPDLDPDNGEENQSVSISTSE